MGLYNLNAGYGQLNAIALASGVATFGKVFIVMPSTDANYQRTVELFPTDPDGVDRVYTTLELAYAAAVTNRNDVILLSANSTHNVAAMLTVAKNRIHFIGLDGGDRLIQQGTKVALSTVAGDYAATMTVTGGRCSFRNIKFLNEGTHANSIAAVIDEGEGTVFKDCSFQKQSDLDQTGVEDFCCRADSASYINCEFGFDTLVQTAARPTLAFASSGGVRAKDNRFVDCRFVAANTQATKVHVLVRDTSAVLFSQIFVRPIFVSTINQTGSCITGNDAVASVSGLVEGNILIVDPATNCTKLGDSVTDNIKVVGALPHATAGIGQTAA